MFGGSLAQVFSALLTVSLMITPVSVPVQPLSNQMVTSLLDNGQSSPNWSADIRLTFTGKNSVWPSVDVGPDDSSNVAWTEGIFDAPMALYFKKVARNGSVLVDDRKLTNWTETEPGYGSSDMSPPQIAVDSMGNVHIAWVDRRDVTSGEIYYTMLDPDGNTLIDDTRLTNNAKDYEHSLSASVDRYDCVHLFWRVGITVGMPILYLKINPSLDDQDGDSADVNAITVIDQMPISYSRAYPRVDVDSQGNVHIIYIGFTHDPLAYRVYYVMLDNVGYILINETEIAAFPTVIDLAMFASGDGFVHVAWAYDQIHYSKLDPYLDDRDGGPANVSEIGIILDRQVSNATGVFKRNPRITEDLSGNVSVVWDQHAGGKPAEFFRTKYAANGSVLIDAEFITNRYQNVVVIAGFLLDTTVDSTGRVYVIWSDARDAGKDEIYYKYSFDTMEVAPQALVADAGGPYNVAEGGPVIFDASASQGPDGVVLQYRWDFDGDGVWDTPFSKSPTATNTWSDDYAGTAYVEVQASLGGPDVIEIIGSLLSGGGWVIGEEKRAQSFVPAFDTVTQVSVDVSLNTFVVPDAPLVLAIRSELNGSDLTVAQVDADGMPVQAENWVVFDVPDIALVPGNTYYVVLYSNSTTAPYEIHITYDAYPNGTAWAVGAGGFWTESPRLDIRMIISGPPPISATDGASVTVNNLAPTIVAFPRSVTVTEGDLVYLSATVTDPGSDDLTFTWSWQMGPAETSTHPNDGTFPFTVSDSSSHIYGDDGIYVANLTVEDDDGGIVSQEVLVTVTNVAPSLSLTVVPSGNEGDSLTFQVRATDLGSDDLTFSWWGHCSGWSATAILYPNDPTNLPDPHPSPEVNPRDVTDIQTVVCGDDGIFQWKAQVEDDDGGLTTMNGTFQVNNLPPSLTVSPPSFVQVDEGVSVTLGATISDPGSDDLTFTWNWDHGPTETHVFYNNGVGPDPPNSPDGTFPFSAADSSTHIYGDDCLCNVSLTVKDDDGGTLTYTTTVEVLNLPPVLVVGDIKAYVIGNLTLRVAGEKWHDVVLRLYDGGVETAVVSVLRVPGSPDDQSVTIQDVVIDLFNGNLSALVEYTPLDDPVNGQLLGANPAWLIFTPCDGGEESRLHHTFNGKHPDTWVWSVEDFNALLVGVNITFEATASDSGSDDLTFTWDWGDGTTTSTTYYNNGIGADSYPSPDVNPITVTDIQKHAFTARRGYVVTLTVEDDDGGVMLFSFDLSL